MREKPRRDQLSIVINLNGSQILIKKQMNVLGIIFEYKLQWTAQVSNTINKSKRALHSIKLIKPYFNNEELRRLITSNFFSILYYNSEILHISTLNHYSKQQLLAASALKL